MKIRQTIDFDCPGIGQKIKKARLADERPLTMICALAGMTTANWYRLEKEEAKFLPMETLRKIESALEVDLGVTFE